MTDILVSRTAARPVPSGQAHKSSVGTNYPSLTLETQLVKDHACAEIPGCYEWNGITIKEGRHTFVYVTTHKPKFILAGTASDAMPQIALRYFEH